MKLGPVTISFAERPTPTPKPDLEEKGATGTGVTPIAGGGGQASRMQLTQQDYNADLAYPQAYDVYDRMRLSDGTVGGLLKAIKLPLLGVEWKVQPASDSAEDVEVADFVDADLNSMTTSLEETLRLVLLMLDYGCMPFEKVWELRDDNRVHLRKLAQRLPKSIIRWDVDEAGGLANVQQQVFKDGSFRTIDIPVEKLVVFVNEREGANWRGISILRNAYKHHYYLDHFYAIDAIAKQRRGAGVDVGTIKESATDKRAVKAAVERVLMSLNVHEKQFVTEAEDEWSYRIESITGNLPRMMESIEHHVNMILRSVLAAFLGLASSTASSSLALSKDQSAFFLLALRAVGSNIEHTMNENVIKPLVDYNYPNVKAYPTLKHGRLDSRDDAAFAQAVAALMNAGALTPGADVEASSREVLELPEQQDGEAVYAAKQAAVEKAAEAARTLPAQEPPTPIRRAMSRRITLAVADTDAIALQAALVLQLQGHAHKLAEGGDYGTSDFTADAQRDMLLILIAAFLLGARQQAGQVPAGVGTQADTWAATTTALQASYLQNFAMDISSGSLTTDAIDQRAALYAGQVWTSYQRGRVAAMQNDAFIVWHAEGDDTTCELCEARDKKVYTKETLPGYPGQGGFGDLCEGGIQCRCWLEYFAGSREPGF